MRDIVICDFCKSRISEGAGHVIQLDPKKSELNGDIVAIRYDLCQVCYESPIILSEQRRTRTRKAKPKIGRPRGRRNTQTTGKGNGADLGAQVETGADPSTIKFEGVQPT